MQKKLTAIAGFLFVLSYLMPLHLPPWRTWHAEASMFFATLIAAWLVIANHWKSRPDLQRLKIPKICVVILLFSGLILLQFFEGRVEHFGVAWIAIGYLGLCFVSSVLGFSCSENYANGERWLTAIAALLLFSGLCSVIFALIQIFYFSSNFEWLMGGGDLRRPSANMAQPNNLATLLAMSMASAVFLNLKNRISKKIFYFFIVILILGISCTESRAGALGALAVVLWAGLLGRRVAGNGFSIFAIFSLGFILLAGFALFPTALNILLLTDAAEVSTTTSFRSIMWPQLVRAILEKPWLGWGVLGTAKAHNAVADQFMYGLPYTYSHNLGIDLAIWFGLPVALFTTAGGALWLVRRFRSVRTSEEWFCISLLLPFLIHSLLEFPFAYTYFIAPAFFCIGFLQKVGGEMVFEDGRGIPRLVAIWVVGVFMSVLFFQCVEYQYLESKFRDARLRMAKIDFSFRDNAPQVFVALDNLEVVIKAISIDPRKRLLDADIKLLNDAVLQYPWVSLHYNLIVALACNGEMLEAIRQLAILRSFYGEDIYLVAKREIEAGSCSKVID